MNSKALKSKKLAFLLLIITSMARVAFVDDLAEEAPASPNKVTHGFKSAYPPACATSLFASIITPYGYPVTSHRIVTEDGYILTAFRIQAKHTNIVSGKKVIFLMHGLMCSADDWVTNSPNLAPALYLADQGYDVWLGNSRGNKYSTGHTNPKITAAEYWNFSFQQMGKYDVPANIKYVLGVTGKSKLTWIGYAQGTTQMFAALTDRVSTAYVNEKVDKLISFSPVVYSANEGTEELRIAASKGGLLASTAKEYDQYLLLPGSCVKDKAFFKLTQYFCQKIFPGYCNNAIPLFDPDLSVDNLARIPYIAQHFPAGASVNCFLHFFQLVKQNRTRPVFQKFDYGASVNQKVYGQSTPPVYNLGNIKIPVSLFIGTKDPLGDMQDNEILYNDLISKGVKVNRHFFTNWGHLTFLWMKDATELFAALKKELHSA